MSGSCSAEITDMMCSRTGDWGLESLDQWEAGSVQWTNEWPGVVSPLTWCSSFMLGLRITRREIFVLIRGLLGEPHSQPTGIPGCVRVTNEKLGKCHPGLLSSMLGWWHLALCLFLLFDWHPVLILRPHLHQPIRGLYCNHLTNEKLLLSNGRIRRSDNDRAQVGRFKLLERENHDMSWATSRTIMSILKQTMSHKARETIAQFTLDTGVLLLDYMITTEECL